MDNLIRFVFSLGWRVYEELHFKMRLVFVYDMMLIYFIFCFLVLKGFICLWYWWEEVSWFSCWSMVHSFRYIFIFSVLCVCINLLLANYSCLLLSISLKKNYLFMFWCALHFGIFRGEWTPSCWGCNQTAKYFTILPLVLEPYHKTLTGTMNHLWILNIYKNGVMLLITNKAANLSVFYQDLAKELLEMFTASKMKKVFFTNSGSEANDTQVCLLSRLIHSILHNSFEVHFVILLFFNVV